MSYRYHLQHHLEQNFPDYRALEAQEQRKRQGWSLHTDVQGSLNCHNSSISSAAGGNIGWQLVLAISPSPDSPDSSQISFAAIAAAAVTVKPFTSVTT